MFHSCVKLPEGNHVPKIGFPSISQGISPVRYPWHVGRPGRAVATLELVASKAGTAAGGDTWQLPGQQREIRKWGLNIKNHPES